MLRWGILGLLTATLMACEATAATVEVNGTQVVISQATVTPAVNVAGVQAEVVQNPTSTIAAVKGGIIRDVLDPTRAAIVRENEISVVVPNHISGSAGSYWMRKAGEWTGIGNATFTVDDLPPGDVTITYLGMTTLIVDYDGGTQYVREGRKLTYLNNYNRTNQPFRFTVLAPADKGWMITVAMPVPR